MKATLTRGWARVRARLAPRVRAFLVGEVRRHLDARRMDAAAEDLGATRAGLSPCEARVRGLRARYDLAPIGPDTTVHAALARDPRVEAALAARGLPRCRDCAVGAEETLAEAAFGEGFDLEGLLRALT